MHPTAQAWLTRSRQELDALFGAAARGPRPEGAFEGTLIVTVPGLAHVVAWAIRLLVWRGKVFEAAGANDARVDNLVTPFGMRSVPGLVYVAGSRLDGRAAWVIDYSKTSWIAKHVRDEIRETAPGEWLGKVWWRGIRVCDFALIGRAAGSERAARGDVNGARS
jgi:hypothetical protein